MAIAAILFSLWYVEIAKTLEIKPKPYTEDNVLALTTIKSIIISKSIPVTLMSSSVAAIFLPDSIRLILNSIAIYRSPEIKFSYDAVQTAYCFVSLISVVLAFYMAILTKQLFSLKKMLQ